MNQTLLCKRISSFLVVCIKKEYKFVKMNITKDNSISSNDLQVNLYSPNLLKLSTPVEYSKIIDTYFFNL